MVADHSMECRGEQFEAALALAGIIVVIFPIGVPLILLILLYGNKDEISNRQTRSGASDLDYIGE